MPEMTDDEVRAFLSEGTRTGKLCTVTSDGSPTAVPIWFLLDGDDVLFMTGATSAKAANLRRDPRAALVVDDEAYPFGFVLVRGTVRWDEDAEDLAGWSRLLAQRYMPDELVDPTAERNAVAGEWLCRLAMERVLAYRDVAAD